jgi:hypothetical protein
MQNILGFSKHTRQVFVFVLQYPLKGGLKVSVVVVTAQKGILKSF